MLPTQPGKTRAAKGSGSIRQRRDGRWEARYTTGRDPGTGKQIQRSLYALTKAEVQRKLQRVLVDIADGNYVAPTKLTVQQWLDVWLAEYNKELRPRTFDLYAGQVNYRIKPGIGALKLSALGAHEVQRFLNKQGEDCPGRPALSPKSLKNLHGILHKALGQAVEIGLLRRNPCDAVKLPRVNKADIRPLDNDQISALMGALQGHPYELLYKVCLFTGIRQGEALGLTWDCVQDGTIYLYRQLQEIGGTYRFAPLKNGKPRRITPAPAVMRLLNEQKRRQLQQRLKAGPAWRGTENYVFADEQGRHLHRPAVYGQFKRVVAGLGLPRTRFHDMRHSYAVAALQAGDDIKTVQENLGHHTAAFTLDVYGHVTERMKKDSAARMDKFIRSVT
jgi:integrase